MRALTEHGYRIPEDISIVGFDNLPQAEMSLPPLTSVDVEKHRIGSTAMEILINKIGSSHELAPVKILIGAHLHTRKSIHYCS